MKFKSLVTGSHVKGRNSRPKDCKTWSGYTTHPRDLGPTATHPLTPVALDSVWFSLAHRPEPLAERPGEPPNGWGTLGSSRCSRSAGEMEAPAAWARRAVIVPATRRYSLCTPPCSPTPPLSPHPHALPSTCQALRESKRPLQGQGWVGQKRGPQGSRTRRMGRGGS